MISDQVQTIEIMRHWYGDVWEMAGCASFVRGFEC